MADAWITPENIEAQSRRVTAQMVEDLRSERDAMLRRAVAAEQDWLVVEKDWQTVEREAEKLREKIKEFEEAAKPAMEKCRNCYGIGIATRFDGKRFTCSVCGLLRKAAGIQPGIDLGPGEES